VLAPEGELLVYGALSTHRETDPARLTIPLFARSVIYDAKNWAMIVRVRTNDLVIVRLAAGRASAARAVSAGTTTRV
jgi:hypothetical protein